MGKGNERTRQRLTDAARAEKIRCNGIETSAPQNEPHQVQAAELPLREIATDSQMPVYVEQSNPCNLAWRQYRPQNFVQVVQNQRFLSQNSVQNWSRAQNCTANNKLINVSKMNFY